MAHRRVVELAGAIKSKPMDALSPFFIVIQERHEWKIYHPVTVALTVVEQGRNIRGVIREDWMQRG